MTCATLPFLLLSALPASALTLQSVALTDAGLSDAIGPLGGLARLPDPIDASRVPAQVRVITAGEIKSSGAKTLADVLGLLPGVVLYDETGSEYQPTLDLRGFNASPVSATAVLVDGVRINEPDFGEINFQLIPLADIERVEVLPGPQTLYGPGAMGGVVNVVTKRGGRKTALEAEALAGSFGFQRYRASVEGPAKPLTYRVSASRETENGYRANSGARILRLDSRLDYRDDKTDASLRYQFGDDDLREAGALTASEIGADRRQNVSFVHLDSLLNIGSLNARRKLTDESAVSINGDVRRRLQNTPLNQGRTSVSQARSGMDGLGATLQFDDDREMLSRRSTLNVGAESARDVVNGSSSGSFGAFGFANVNRDVQRRLGFFAQEAFDLLPRILTLTAGVRQDRVESEHADVLTPSNNFATVYDRVSPRVGLNYNPVPGLETFVSLSDSFRAPTIDEITALQPFTTTPNLRPASARSAEAGAKVQLGGWGEGSVSVYRTIVHEEIFPVFDPTQGFGRNINIDKTRRDGLEVTLRPRFGALVDGFVSYGYTEATFQSAFTLDKAPFPATQQVHSGDELPGVPRHTAAFGADVHPVKGATFGFDERCVSSRRLFGDEGNAEPTLGGYCVAGGGGSYERGSYLVYFRADNILNRFYETRGILSTNPSTGKLERFINPAPGISFSVGVRWRVGG